MVTTLVFLPGTLCDDRVWQPVTAQLAAYSQAPLTTQTINFGACNSVGAMAERALETAATTAGPIIPIGLSMGGMVALEMWRQAPERISAMVLCDTDPSGDSPIRNAQRQAQRDTATAAGIGAMIATLFDKYFVADTATQLSALREIALDMAVQQGLPILVAQHQALESREDYWTLLPQITVPVLVLCGAADTICSPTLHARVAASLPQATYKIISNAAHLAPLQQPVQVAGHILDWLKQFNGSVSAKPLSH